MTIRGILIALAISLLLWLFLWWMISLTHRGFDPTAVKTVNTTTTRPASPSTTSSTTTTLPPATTTTARARTAPNVSAASASRPTPAAVTGDIPNLIRQGFARFGQAVAEQAVRVSGCETGRTYDPAVVNSSGHTGLFQLSPRYHTARAQKLGFTWDQMRQAVPNIAVAADLYAEQGWRPWTCRYAA